MSYIPQTQVMFATSYNLNSSFTKQVVIGVEFNETGKLDKILKLISSHPQCSISLSLQNWKTFKKYFDLINAFFNGDEAKGEINCGSFQLRFDHFCGKKTVILAQNEHKRSH